MKRSSTSSRIDNKTRPLKKHRKGGDKSHAGASPDATDSRERVVIEELSSARTLASSHLLAVAKLPLDVLSTRWSEGKNRPVDEDHIDKLRRSFINRGFGRLDQENYMKVTCSAEAVDAIKAHLRKRAHSAGDPVVSPGGGQTTSQKQSSEPLDFRAWAEVTDELAELLDGQHRLKAAHQALGAGNSSEKWWTCEIYNKGMKSWNAPGYALPYKVVYIITSL
ncbi:hypothetical protein TGAM01_v211180 [Trichoderma gamsii]|uniref:Uncharacterized protein n=1 Tax=Trichoderma gamsii TaxID=398673 RepID=A0A2P4Z6P6_9HYPO|nr:hypothetical protein TGAM01_v211180 [Trichoderma gamsii]PON19955.1 hypothetical protein TGAM01_v211180 [Trichoderma gamsii]